MTSFDNYVIKRALESNGSPAPTFRTDDERSFFEVEIFCHPAFLEDSLVGNDQVSYQAEEELAKGLQPEHMKVLHYALKPAKRKDILEDGLGLANHIDNLRRYIDPLLEDSLLELTITDRPSSPLQRYITTEKGQKLLQFQQKQ